jgi:hypothetical protein
MLVLRVLWFRVPALRVANRLSRLTFVREQEWMASPVRPVVTAECHQNTPREIISYTVSILNLRNAHLSFP